MALDRIQPQEATREVSRSAVAPRSGQTPAVGFEEVLRTQGGYAPGLRFSAHARQRMESGGVNLDGESMARLERAVSEADRKGARDALVLMDDLALLVSISNRTVITAVDQARRRSGVFTNIDSVVMA